MLFETIRNKSVTILINFEPGIQNPPAPLTAGKPNDARGQCYKMTEERIKQAQGFLDNSYSQKRTAREIGVNEATIRYHLKKGTLKKNN